MRPPCQTYGFPPVHFLKEGDIVFGKKRYDGSGNGRLKSSARPRCSSHPIKNDLVLTFIRKGCIFTNTAVPHVPSQCGVFLSTHVICNFTSRKMESVDTALFWGCLSLPAQKDRHHYDNNEPIFLKRNSICGTRLESFSQKD